MAMGMATATDTATGAAVKQPRVNGYGAQTDCPPLTCREAVLCSPLKQACWALLVGLCAGSTFAQDAGGTSGGGLRVTSRLAVTQTWTDNNTLSSTNRDAALITLVTPGISVLSSSGTIKGSLDYSLSGVLYVKTDARNRFQQNLAAQGSTELIKNFLSVDAQASITQQVASAFGQQTIDNSLNNPNRIEVTSLSLAPHFKGRLARLAGYDLRVNFAETIAKDSVAGDSRNQGGSLRFDGLGTGPLNWWTMASGQQSSFKAGGNNMSAMVRLGLIYRPVPDLSFGINAGRERNDYLSTGVVGSNNGKTNSSTAGVDASWALSPRTKLTADWQSHEYGDAHTFNFDYRMARSSIRLLSSQSVSLGNGSNSGGLNSNYDLYFLQFASLEPDLVKRDLLVRSTLQNLGLNPNAVATSGFLTSSPTLQEAPRSLLHLAGLTHYFDDHGQSQQHQ
ncbi:TIGR03016 family PEP-CTERM system-associated outer membrane protein [Roseateles sp. GG27B]